MLMAYHWPGNVRELENCIERAVLLSDDDVIHGHHLPPSLQTAESSGTVPRGTLRATLERIERELLVGGSEVFARQHGGGRGITGHHRADHGSSSAEVQRDLAADSGAVKADPGTNLLA